VGIPNTDRVLWIGLTAPDDERWELVAFDPGEGSSAAVRVAEGAATTFGDIEIEFSGVTSIPSAVGVGVPGGDSDLLAQLLADEEGGSSLMLVSSDRPAISLAEGDPTVVGNYEYTFEGAREFAGISVKRDSGAWFIWIATGMLLIGLAVTFYLPRRRLWLRLTDQATYIAALAEKSGGFEKDMRAFAGRIDVPVPPEIEEER
jgi:cytochrome c biogenesis protein ResB